MGDINVLIDDLRLRRRKIDFYRQITKIKVIGDLAGLNIWDERILPAPHHAHSLVRKSRYCVYCTWGKFCSGTYTVSVPANVPHFWFSLYPLSYLQ